VALERVGQIAAIAEKFGVPAVTIGQTIAEHRMEVRWNGAALFATPVSELFGPWDTALERLLEQ
jgi:phosphoribosylformylglycinamidine (FGAM) synthase-like enzyme